MTTRQRFYRINVIVLMLAFTLSLHYMLLPVPHWIHLFHRRLCYIPIILGSIWFGLTGGVVTAALLSLAVLPLAIQAGGPLPGNEELIEIVFYLGIGLLTGFLVQKGERSRRQKEKAERELARAERLALAGQTAAGIAHEVRTPLGAILGASEIFAEDFPEGHPHRKFFDILQKESRRLAKVIEDFLDLSRPIVIEPVRVELNELLRECEDALRDQAMACRVSILRPNSPEIWVTADPQRLYQAVMNVLLNAVQLAPEETTVQISAQILAGGEARIRVEDEGPGILSGEESRLFEPFFSRRKDGTGLGLSLARQIVAAHGGTIGACNRPSGGAVFEIRLPGEETT